MGKGEIARNEKTVSPFVHIFAIISLFAAQLKEPEIGIEGKELIVGDKGKPT